MGWAGGRGVDGKLKAGNNIHKETNSSVVCSLLHRNSHSQPVVDRRGFTELSKDHL